jgi:hypothetical protein
MKPVRRRIRRHFGLTAKQVAVRSKRPWYLQWGITGLYIAVGYLLAYWQFSSGNEVYQKLLQRSVENQSLLTKIIQVERQLQIAQAAQTNLAKELNAVQDENMHIKEDLFFYKNMLNGKK